MTMDGQEYEIEQIEGELPEVSLEDRARAMGWKPRDEYNGVPSRWTDAETFIRRGESELPILRDQSRRMAEKLARNETEIAELKASVNSAMSLARRADEAGYQRGLAELRARQREAVETGDVATYDNLDEQIRAAETERARINSDGNVVVPMPAEPTPEPVPQQDDPVTAAFKAANPWFAAKPLLRTAMIQAHSAIVEMEGRKSGPELVDQYDRAKAEVMEAYPQYFEAQRDPAAPPPSQAGRLRPRPALSPQNGPVRSGSPSPFARITNPQDRAEAEAAFRGIAKYDPQTTAEEYVALYLGEQVDVVEMIQNRRKG